MAQGRKTGGRKKGVPNKVTSAAREAFLALFDRVTPDLESWIRQTANGWDEEVVIGRGENQRTAVIRTGKDPGKAADLVLRMAEYHVPKLAKSEIEASGPGGGPLVIERVTYTERKD